MPSSFRVKLSKLRYKGRITNEEYQKLNQKLDGHDARPRVAVIDEFVEAIEKHQTRQDSYFSPPYVEMGLDTTDVLEVAEQLKEKTRIINET